VAVVEQLEEILAALEEMVAEVLVIQVVDLVQELLTQVVREAEVVLLLLQMAAQVAQA
jgi:hypothetical protein